MQPHGETSRDRCQGPGGFRRRPFHLRNQSCVTEKHSAVLAYSVYFDLRATSSPPGVYHDGRGSPRSSDWSIEKLFEQSNEVAQAASLTGQQGLLLGAAVAVSGGRFVEADAEVVELTAARRRQTGERVEAREAHLILRVRLSVLVLCGATDRVVVLDGNLTRRHGFTRTTSAVGTRHHDQHPQKNFSHPSHNRSTRAVAQGVA